MMLLLDTNILSAMMRPDPAPVLATWIAAQPLETLFTAAICQAEILAGLAIMPLGRRRHALEAAAHAMFQEDFADRILPFDTAAARTYADHFAARRQSRRQSGRPCAMPDLMIAAIAGAHSATVVTRDSGGFAGCGLTVIDPWSPP